MKSKKTLLFNFLVGLCFLFSTQMQSQIQTDYQFKLAHCVGKKTACAWVGKSVVVMIEGETASNRSKNVMDKVLATLSTMQDTFIEISGQSNLPLQSGFQGKPVIEVVLDNCGAGGLAHHGSLGMSTGKGLFNEVYDAAKQNRKAIHQVFLYETARNFYLPKFNKKFDWIMNDEAANWGWWTVGFNNAQAVMIPKLINSELLYFGNTVDQFRQGMVSKFEHYLANPEYNFNNTWRKDRLPWRPQASVNDLMTGMIIYSFEKFGGHSWIKNVYRYMNSSEIVNRTNRNSYQECRDNIYKIWSISANRDLISFFENDLRWTISENAKTWVNSKNRCNWSHKIGKGIDIGAGANKVFVVGTDKSIHRWNNGNWIRMPGVTNVKRIDVAYTSPYIVTDSYDIYRNLNNKKWEKVPGKALDIGGNNNALVVIGTNNRIYKYRGHGKWNVIGEIGGKRIDVSKNGNPWIVGMDNKVYQWLGHRWDKKGDFKASDISISENGDVVWAIELNSGVPFIYKGSGKWEKFKGILKNISAQDNGDIWGTNSNNNIYENTCTYLNQRSVSKDDKTISNHKDTILLYPNPTSGKVLVEISAAQNSTLIATIVDTNGRVLYKNNLTQEVSNSNTHKLALDFSAFEKGMYILKVATNGKPSISKKFVIH